MSGRHLMAAFAAVAEGVWEARHLTMTYDGPEDQDGELFLP